MYSPLDPSLCITTTTRCRKCGRAAALTILFVDAPITRDAWRDWYVCSDCEDADDERKDLPVPSQHGQVAYVP